MKVISLLQPWATLVVIGAKKIETRSWNTKYRGPVLIHASKAMKPFQKDLCYQPFFKEYMDGVHDDLPLGAIIGKANLINTAPTSYFLSFFGDNPKTGLAAQLNAEQEKAFGDYSPWRYGWLFSDPVQFIQPMPAKGSLGLWNYEIDNDIKIW